MQEGITKERTILEIENSIRLHLTMSTQGIIGAGNDLIEAKAKLPHGTFDQWVSIKFGLSHRTANNFMRIAREVDPQSTLARLQYTKVLALLDVPAEEREKTAEELHAEETSVSELKKALAERDAAKQRADNQEKIIEQMQERIIGITDELNAAKDAEPKVITVTKAPDDYEQLKTKLAGAEKRAQAAENYAMRAEESMKKAQADARRYQSAQLEAGADMSADPYSAEKLGEAVRSFMGAVGALPSMQAYFNALESDRLKLYGMQCEALRAWVLGMQKVLEEAEAFGADGFVVV